MTISLTIEQIRRAAPNGRADMVAAIAAQSGEVFTIRQLNTENRVLGFMSIVLEETGGLTQFVEDDNYSAARAAQVFPRIFPNVAAAMPYEHDPRAFCNKVYGGRMGNTGPDDGWLYRGQGLIQVTGRDNYAFLAKRTGLPLLLTPSMVSSPEHALECAATLFSYYAGVMEYCDAGNFQAVWALVGSGSARGPVINLQNHQNALAAARRIFEPPSAPAPPVKSIATIVAPKTETGIVSLVQRWLIDHGAADVTVDGVYGPKTKAAWDSYFDVSRIR